MFLFRQLDNEDENDRQGQKGEREKEKGEERNLLRTYKISQTNKLLFHEHESDVQITNDKDS